MQKPALRYLWLLHVSRELGDPPSDILLCWEVATVILQQGGPPCIFYPFVLALSETTQKGPLTVEDRRK